MMRNRLGLVAAAGHAAVLPAGANRRDGGCKGKQSEPKMDALS
jgi:hypothetical protein